MVHNSLKGTRRSIVSISPAVPGDVANKQACRRIPAPSIAAAGTPGAGAAPAAMAPARRRAVTGASPPHSWRLRGPHGVDGITAASKIFGQDHTSQQLQSCRRGDRRWLGEGGIQGNQYA